MYSVKNSQASKYYKNEPLSAKNSSAKYLTLDNLSTESQQERIKKLMSDVRKGGLNSPHSVIISQSELLRMKNSAQFVTKEQLIQQKRLLEEQQEKLHAAARAKKQRMLEIEAEKKKTIPPTESEMETTFKNDSLKERAKLLMNEDKDEVKSMNQMMLYAKVVTIRDKQVHEKKRLHNEYKVEEKRKDLMMEIERLTKIKYYEDAERKLKEEQRKAAMETIQQVKEREMERMKEQEEREREGQEMLKHIKQLQREEAVAAQAKKNQQKALLDTIFDANQQAIAKKHEKVLEERAEEERIVQYNIEKGQKEAAYQAELKSIKDEKEREIQKLRELQEKASDRQAEIDALRAKRASELADRLAREKERKEAELRDRLNEELLEARHQQSLEKHRLLEEQAVADRAEFDRIIHSQKLERELESMKDRERANRMKDHSNQLKKQIAINEEKKRQDKKELLEEGKKIKDKLSNEKKLLETIKQSKIEELVVSGIENKYTSELARKRIMI